MVAPMPACQMVLDIEVDTAPHCRRPASAQLGTVDTELLLGSTVVVVPLVGLLVVDTDGFLDSRSFKYIRLIININSCPSMEDLK
jgi:hypothetical protein